MSLQFLDTEAAASGRMTPALSRCTAAMSRFISRIATPPQSDIDPTAVYALINMVQGRVLEYLAERICRIYDVYDKQATEKISVQLSSIFSDEFFALFRAKIDRLPSLVLHIAQRIIAKECHSGDSGPCNVVYMDRMYSALFRKYFEYRHLGALLAIVSTDARIQRTIVQALARQKIHDAALVAAIDDTLAHDPDGVYPALMIGYLRDDRVGELARAMGSPQWLAAASRQRARLAHLRGE